MHKKIYLLIMALSLVWCYGVAQKLPNVQQSGLRAPDDTKVDGKAAEWSGRFQAYNHATDVYYVMANSNEKLYLTVRATDANIINKIISGGITFNICPTTKKDDKTAASITYPLFERKNRPVFDRRSKTDIGQASATATPLGDSLLNVHNRLFTERSKFVGVLGLSGIDTLISVYNDNGIKAAGLFDHTGALTVEFSVDLKLLHIDANNAQSFAYHIVLNGRNPFENQMTGKAATTSSTGQTSVPLGYSDVMEAKVRMEMMQSPEQTVTDFWGTYTLIK